MRAAWRVTLVLQSLPRIFGLQRIVRSLCEVALRGFLLKQRAGAQIYLVGP